MNSYLMCPICEFAHANVLPEGHPREKECQDCHHPLALDAFPIHASSWDGHRKSCTQCLAPKKAADQAKTDALRTERRAMLMIPASRPAEITFHETFHDRKEVAQTAARLFEQDALIFDCETTGLNPEYHRMVSLSVLRMSGQLVLDTLINPRRPIPPETSKIHGIYDRDVADAPSWYSVWRYELLPLLQHTPQLVIFNARFDIGFMEAAVKSLRKLNPQVSPIPQLQVFCAMNMATSWNQSKPFLSLDQACQLSGISREKEERHTASGDTYATRHLLLCYAHTVAPTIMPSSRKDLADVIFTGNALLVDVAGVAISPDPSTIYDPSYRGEGSLSWALEHSPSHEAGNDCSSWGCYPIEWAKLLPNGHIKVSVYKLEGEYSTHLFTSSEEAAAYLFSEDGMYWEGTKRWYSMK